MRTAWRRWSRVLLRLCYFSCISADEVLAIARRRFGHHTVRNGYVAFAFGIPRFPGTQSRTLEAHFPLSFLPLARRRMKKVLFASVPFWVCFFPPLPWVKGSTADRLGDEEASPLAVRALVALASRRSCTQPKTKPKSHHRWLCAVPSAVFLFSEWNLSWKSLANRGRRSITWKGCSRSLEREVTLPSGL